MFPPFYTAFGKLTRVGKGVFVNFDCTFLDRGGITLDDDVFIGPGVKLVTENHPEDPALRRNVYTRPIHLKRKAWIGAGAIILPGVTVGKTRSLQQGLSLPKMFLIIRSLQVCLPVSKEK